MKPLRSMLFFAAKTAGAAVFLIALIWLFAWMFRPDVKRPRVVRPPEEVAAVEAARNNLFDPERIPVLHQDVDYSQGPDAPWYPKGEAPVLAELVAEGLLPPVAERTGPEPVVIRGVDGIGTYGGSWYRVSNSDGDVAQIAARFSGAFLARWSPHGYPVKPHLAKGWDISDDFREYTIYLRKGMRWSDGHPFTARDFVYWWEQEALAFDVHTPRHLLGGILERVEMIDETTVRIVFEEPNGLFQERMAFMEFWAPEHYLKPFNPVTGDPEKIAQLMAVQATVNPRAAYARLRSWNNPEHPRLWPWVLREHQGFAPYSFVRNPYYWAVDPEGNQLPYLDRLVNDVRSDDMLAVTAASGDISMQMRNIRFEDHTLYMESRESGGFDVYFWRRSERSGFVVFPNMNRRVDPARPETAWKQQMLSDRRFRQALSLAIDRHSIIDAEYQGYGEPAQLAPGPESMFHHEELYRAFTQYDPETANRLLDELGLEQRDSEGFRTFPDGTRMTFFLSVTEFTGIGPSQFLIDDWRNVGVRVVLRLSARNLWFREAAIFEHDLAVWTGDSELYPIIAPRNFVATGGDSFYAPAFGTWYALGGLRGDPRADRELAQEPPPGHPLRRGMEVLEAAGREGSRERQVEVFREVLDLAAEHLWTINISTPPPQLVIVKNGFRNVPRSATTGWTFYTPANTGIETYFYEQPFESPGALAAIRRAIVSVTPNPRLTVSDGVPHLDARPGEGDGRIGHILRILFIAIAVLLLVLALVRHPFIVRRLVILVPTLFIISVAIFTIIQLPPGDFMTVRIQELEMAGDESAARQLEELKDLFHFDKSQVEQYVRWIGLPWFISFNPADRGLLQGHLGLSMETVQRVNALVGDRILLTMLISLFTILFTWAVAIPIGLYSALRQYSLGDYLVTFFGFIGMCVPPMLLALLLMYVGSAIFGMPVGGLFSPEYALQPEWTWGKFVDLLQHIWIPVIVLGAGGTAGMIRVLRANLLDELGKPYVTTARAKGVRPLKLVLKYPLRLALNPFISGIGNIFPALVSGGAIVSIVLSLPTVGPLLLSALQMQDMYLAGSMLMVLSLLTVLGTLVSDLLLMWVDPRIRMTKGGGS